MNLPPTLHYPRTLVFAVIFSLASLGLVLLASACGSNQPVDLTATPTLTVTATFPPTLTPTPIPLGRPENPFVIGVVSETNDGQIPEGGNELARQMSALTNTSVRAAVFPSYQALVDELSAGTVHIAWLPPLTYLYTSNQGTTDVFAITNHFGVFQYGTQFMANIESEFTPYFDPVSGYNSANAATALSQFAGQRPCWVEPQSASGYIVPAGLLKLNEIDTLPAVITQNHSSVVRALYIKGICDFGASFSISGDPRTASAVQQDLPDAINRIMIIWRSDSIIPNLNLSFHTKLSESERQTLATALLEIAKTPEGKGLLSLTAGNYQIEDIRPFNDDVYNPLRDLIEAVDLDLEETIGK